MSKVAKDYAASGAAVHMASGTGMHASHADVGAMEEQLRRHVEVHQPDYEELRARLLAEIPTAVQRVNMIQLFWCRNEVEVTFRTKDDYGYYEYSFSCPLPHLKKQALPPKCKRDNVTMLAYRISSLLVAAETATEGTGVWGAFIDALEQAESAVDKLFMRYRCGE